MLKKSMYQLALFFKIGFVFAEIKPFFIDNPIILQKNLT
jgi:hypothetical protein